MNSEDVALDAVIISQNIDCQVILETVCHANVIPIVNYYNQDLNDAFRVMASHRCNASDRSQLVPAQFVSGFSLILRNFSIAKVERVNQV